MMKLSLILLWAFGLGVSTAGAATSSPVIDENPSLDYRVHIDEQENRFNLGLYGEASQFSFQGRSLLGNALEVDATYALKSSLAANVSVAQAVTLQGGLGVLYTGIRAAGQYAFRGSFIRKESTVIVNGQKSVETKVGARSLFAGDLGFEQFIFNGTSRVVPATGVSLGLRYDRNLGNFRISLIGRYGTLLVASETSSMMTLGAGLIYSF